MKRDRTYHRRMAEEFLKGLSREQKLLVISGTMKERQAAGLPPFDGFGEAAHGVQARHDQSFDLGIPEYTTVFPNPVGFAATWDKSLMREIGEVTGTEARSLFIHGRHEAVCMLAPTIDMERDPRWGRNEEAYGEDPHLTSRMAGEYILGMAGEDPTFVRCGATLKHFYGNNVEDDRSLSDSNIPEHLKDSYYIHVFEEVIDYADPLGVMSSYNYVNGIPNTFNPELNMRLKKRGLPYISGDGGVISLSVEKQKEASSMAEALTRAIRAGMDSFPENQGNVRAGLREALESGMLAEEELDQVVLTRLTVYSMLGLFPGQEPFSKEEYDPSRVDTAEGRALSRRASSEAAVLLKNKDGILPLSEEKVLLLGPFADRCPMDWYSGITSHQVTLKEGLGENAAVTEALYPYVRIRLGETDYAGRNETAGADRDETAGAGRDETAGADRDETAGAGQNKSVYSGQDKTYYAGLDGTRMVPVEKEKAEIFRIMLWDDSRITLRSVTSGKLLTSHNPSQKIINSEIPEENFELHANSEEAFSWFLQEVFQLIAADGKTIHFTEENALHFWEDERIAGIRNHDGSMGMTFETVTTPEKLLEQAVQASDAKRVIAAFGLHPMVNGKEERDRTTIDMPPFQRVMLRKIREAYPEVILVLHTNSPIAIVEEQEAEEIRGILWMATGSEEYGNALADVLFGRVSPAGGLCQTWYRSDNQLPAITDYDIEKNKTTYIYMEDEPLYRFGYGLSYTTFEEEIVAQEAGSVTVRVRNTGDRVSDHVVQVYKRPSGDYRLFEDRSEPGCRLTAFERLKDLEPGAEVELRLDCRY